MHLSAAQHGNYVVWQELVIAEIQKLGEGSISQGEARLQHGSPGLGLYAAPFQKTGSLWMTLPGCFETWSPIGEANTPVIYIGGSTI